MNSGQNASRVHLNLGPMAFEFASHQQWVNKAQSWFNQLAFDNRLAAQKRYLSIDAAGRVCMIGRDFSRARDEDTFPVRVYLIDQVCAEADESPAAFKATSGETQKP